ncbi:MAG: hypothetical protein ACI8Y4_003356 [Candidatus Poriferisodalaceae bacterium]|jgi:hypothetical protein
MTDAQEIDPRTNGVVIDAITATVAYSDVFEMPVRIDQLHPWLIGAEVSADKLLAAVDDAVESGAVVNTNGRLHLPGSGDVVDIAEAREALAVELWPTARKWARVIARLPFVRMIGVTGGLACDSVEPYDDIDLFIVVAPGRLWLTRLAIVALARAVDVRGPELCPNYIVATDTLEFDVRSVYVAREIAQMIPLHGELVYRDILAKNDWYLDHVPNHEPIRVARKGSVAGPGVVRRILERALAASVFDRLERWEMQRKVQKLTTVSSRRDEVGRPDESSFSPSVCKGHMVGNAAGIDVAWRERWASR